MNNAGKYTGIPRWRYHFPKNRLYDLHSSKRRDLYAALDYDSRAGFVALLVIALVVATGVYVLPTRMAGSMGGSYRMLITLLNLLLGWTIFEMAYRPDLGSHDRQRWEF